MPKWLYWSSPNLFNPNGTFIYCAFSSTQLSTFRPVDTVNGTFVYCAFSDAQLAIFRPIDSLNGNFIYCAFDINNSGFDRTP